MRHEFSSHAPTGLRITREQPRQAALAERDRFAAAGLERAKAFTWEETARITADVYRSVLAQ